MSRKKYTFNERIDAKLAEIYASSGKPLTLPAYARQLGWPEHALYQRAARLGLGRPKYKPWTPEEDEIIIRNISHSPYTIMERLAAAGYQRSQLAIQLHIAKRALKTYDEFMSAREVALGLGEQHHKVTKWITSRMLKARVSDGGGKYLIREQWVRDFIRQHPMEVDLRKVDQIWFLNVVFDGNLATQDRIGQPRVLTQAQMEANEFGYENGTERAFSARP